jgi:hypothetical protein
VPRPVRGCLPARLGGPRLGGPCLGGLRLAGPRFGDGAMTSGGAGPLTGRAVRAGAAAAPGVVSSRRGRGEDIIRLAAIRDPAASVSWSGWASSIARPGWAGAPARPAPPVRPAWAAAASRRARTRTSCA